MNVNGAVAVKKMLPERVLGWLRGFQQVVPLGKAYGYDALRYVRFSSTRSPLLSMENLAAAVTERYHAIEKGLSLPSPRSKFGASALARLSYLTREYVERYGEDEVTAHAAGAVRAYIKFNSSRGFGVEDLPVASELKGFWMGLRTDEAAGTKTVRRSAQLEAIEDVGEVFFTSRHSVRQFAPMAVGDSDIESAVRIAMTAPAVCNREFCRVRTFRSRDRIDQILEYQGGAKGFSGSVPALAVVTASISSYWNPSQRNQGWIDGGMFAMAFLLGLHARGLGAVCLNWSKTPDRDRGLRQLVDLADGDMVVMLVAFGHLQEEFVVASSQRRSVELTWLDEQ